MEHIRAICKTTDCVGCLVCNCYLCDVCFGFEGSLTTHCPRVRVEEEHQQLVYKSTLDFQDGEWMSRALNRWEAADIAADIIVDAVATRLNRERKEETMNNLGAVNQYPQLAQIYQAIANRQPTWAFNDGAGPVNVFKAKDLYYIDYEGRRYVEQNKHSHSEYAARARRGACIVWVIEEKGGQYLGRIEDGVVYMKGTVGSA